MTTARRVVSVVCGVGLLLLAVGALVARYVPIPGHRTLYAVIASPYLMPAALIASLIFLWSRRWLMAAVASAVAMALVVPQVPWYVSADAPAHRDEVRAMTVNLLFGNADPESVLRVAANNADVLLLQKLTPEAVRRLTAAGIDRAFPHRAVDAREGAGGAAIYSRYALTAVENVPGYEMAMVKAELRPDGARDDLTVVSMHFAAPWPQPIQHWHNDFGRFPDTLAELASRAGDAPIVVGGDFNATIDMRPYRDLLTNGYRDAAEQAGAGREFTYPSNRRIPPFMGIDHFLTRNATAVSARAVNIQGTDHRALLATVAPTPTSSLTDS